MDRALEAFNARDLERSFAGLPEDVEWAPLPVFPDIGVLRGRDELLDFFSQLLTDWPTYRVELLEHEDDGRVIRRRLRGSSERADARGIGMELTMVQTWETDPQGRLRVVEELEESRMFE
jgi:hypothetical protein